MIVWGRTISEALCGRFFTEMLHAVSAWAPCITLVLLLGGSLPATSTADGSALPLEAVLANTGQTEGVLLIAEQTRRPAADSGDATSDGVGIGGFVSNETFSVIGSRFAQAFNDKWSEPKGVRDLGYTITLGENPAPRLGAQVFVKVEGTMLSQAYLRPNRRQIQQAAQQAVQRATLYLQKYYQPREVY